MVRIRRTNRLTGDRLKLTDEADTLRLTHCGVEKGRSLPSYCHVLLVLYSALFHAWWGKKDWKDCVFQDKGKIEKYWEKLRHHGWGIETTREGKKKFDSLQVVGFFVQYNLTWSCSRTVSCYRRILQTALLFGFQFPPGNVWPEYTQLLSPEYFESERCLNSRERDSSQDWSPSS